MIEYTLLNVLLLELNVYSGPDKFYGRSKFGQNDKEKEKKEEIWLSPMTNALIPTEMSKGQQDITKTSPSSITQRLRTDLGRSDGVTTVIQL